MKKLIALVLALALVLASCAVAFADDPAPTNYAVDTPSTSYSSGDQQYDNKFADVADNAIAIGGLEEGDEVKFYKVIGVNPDAAAKISETTTLAAGGWEVVAPFSSASNENKLTVEEFKAIMTTGITDVVAGKIGKSAIGTADYTVQANGSGVATQDAPAPGLYVAIITPANAGWMFNPVFVAADYYTTTGGDKSSSWTVDTDLSYSNEAMAKKEPITVTKTAAETSEAANETDAAKAVGVGDEIKYTISTTIPEFANNYLTPLFVVSDTLSDGLTLNTEKGITVTATELATGDHLNTDDYVISYPASGPDFKVTFKPESLIALSAHTPITIEYYATVTEDAITNVNEEDNTVVIEYSHNPSVDEEGEGKKVGDKTHHYTFTIDGLIWGDTETHTTEVVKVGVDKDGNEITATRTINGDKQVGALKDAEFELYIDEALTTKYNKGALKGKTIISDIDGRLRIKGSNNDGLPGLDAGTYYLVETKAPDGYIKKQTATKIEIKTTGYWEVEWTEGTGLNKITYSCDDLLKGYEVYIDDAKTATYTLNYTNVDGSGKPTNDAIEDNTSDMITSTLQIHNSGAIKVGAEAKITDDDGKIVNTQGVELPSTGGIGTTIFYILGGLLVIGAAVILVARRKAHE